MKEGGLEAQLGADGYTEIETHTLEPRPPKGEHGHAFFEPRSRASWHLYRDAGRSPQSGVAADRFTVIDAVNKSQQQHLISTGLASWRIAGSRTAARLASRRTTERPPSQLNRDANIQLEVRALSNLCTARTRLA